MKFQQMLLTRIQNSLQKSVHMVTCGSIEIFIHVYIKYLYFTECTHYVQCIKNVQSLQYFRICFHVNESNA